MKQFKSYLQSRRIAPEKKLAYYLAWVSQFYAFCDKEPGDDVSRQEVDRFLKHLTRRREEWQVDQASEAIQLFIYFNRRNHQAKALARRDSDSQWKAVAEDMVRMLRLKHRSLTTEWAYMGWVRSFSFSRREISSQP